MLRTILLTTLALSAATTAAASDIPAVPAPLEQSVLAELNRIRSAPAAYAGELRTFRTWFDGTLLHVPGMNVGVRTVEGVTAVDEALVYLEREAGAPPLTYSPLLAAAAADHAAYLAGGAKGHFWSDGTGPWDRVRQRGGGPNVAEIISFGFEDSREVARQFLVDDGVRDRGHRTAMFDRRYRYAGVACGPHPRYRATCVIELSTTPDGR